jgi:hypothetical protein
MVQEKQRLVSGLEPGFFDTLKSHASAFYIGVRGTQDDAGFLGFPTFQQVCWKL